MKKIILWGFGDVESDISDFIEISGCKITTHFLERPKKPGQIAFGDLHSGQFLQKPLKI